MAERRKLIRDSSARLGPSNMAQVVYKVPAGTVIGVVAEDLWSDQSFFRARLRDQYVYFRAADAVQVDEDVTPSHLLDSLDTSSSDAVADAPATRADVEPSSPNEVNGPQAPLEDPAAKLLEDTTRSKSVRPAYDLRTDHLLVRPPRDAPPKKIPPQQSPPLVVRSPENAPPKMTPPQQGPPQGAAAGAASTIFERASFGRRVGAWFLDYLISNLLGLVPALVVGVVVYLLVLPDFYTPAEQESAIDAATVSVIFVDIVVAAMYFWIGNSTGGTFGKRVLGLRVVRARHGGDLGLGAGLGRYIVWVIGSLPLFLGWWWAAWDKQGQAWHDIVVDSMVVRKVG